MVEVSIIIINYNTFQLTSNCIASIYQQCKGLSFEIILVDNASIECKPLIFKEKFPDIILIESAENVGFSKGNNLGIEVAKGEYILFYYACKPNLCNYFFCFHKRFVEKHIVYTKFK